MGRFALLVVAALLAGPAVARTVSVGEGGVATLAAAVRAAGDGDTIHLGPGEYFECAALGQRNMVLEGVGPATVISDKTCEGKALLIARGDNLTVRDLVLTRARVPDMNGAGIRLEAQGLTLERVRFVNNQVGLLAGEGGPGIVRVTECVFEGGGVAGERPTAALMVGAVALLHVERSTFHDVKGGQIVTAAVRTELAGDRIETGVEPGAGVAVQAAGGMLMMEGNVLVLGPNPPAHDTAVLALGTGVALRGNRLEDTTGHSEVLLLDWTRSTPVLEGNSVPPEDSLVSSRGSFRHSAGGIARDVASGLRSAAGSTKRAVSGVFGR